MENFIKVLSTIGAQYIHTKLLNVIQVDNNSPTDWYVRAVFDAGIGSYSVIDGIATSADAHKLARELAESLGVTDPETFKP